MRYANNLLLRDYLDRGAAGAHRDHMDSAEFELDDAAFRSVHFLLRHGLPGVERQSTQRRLYRFACSTIRILIGEATANNLSSLLPGFGAGGSGGYLNGEQLMIQVVREQHESSPDVKRRLRCAGGINRFGEPNYRAVWGWSRLDWVGGKWEDRDAEGNLLREVVELRQVPKYAPHDRWHIERWLPPEAYGSPRDWYAQTIERENGISVPALGPYPERGEYEHCFTLAGPGGEFLQLTCTVAEYIARAIESGLGVGAAARRTAIDRREEQQEREYDAWAWDVLDSGTPAFRGLHLWRQPKNAQEGQIRPRTRSNPSAAAARAITNPANRMRRSRRSARMSIVR